MTVIPTNQKGVAQIAFILILLAGIVAGVYLVQHTQIFQPQAAYKPKTSFKVRSPSSDTKISQINAQYDNTGIHHLYWNGLDLLAGNGGYYIIGSCSGADISAQNVTSLGSDGHILYAPGSCPGSPYSMIITGNNPYHVSITVGPLAADYNSLSVSIDPVKEYFEKYTFSHSGYRVGCSSTWTNKAGNSDTFASIPTPCLIAELNAYVGVAQVISADVGSWIEETGPKVTIRRTIVSTNAKNTDAVNHPGTNSIVFGFDIEPPYHQTLLKGSTYNLVEDILITEALGPCHTIPTGSVCIFDTRASFNGGESITAYGKGYNWDSYGTPSSDNGFDLTSISRYSQGPCAGKGVGQCTFDTRASFNNIESVTAYGKGYNWNVDSTPWSNNGFDLTSISRYAQGPCLGQATGQCKFDTRTSLNGIESITAYGKFWNWNADGSAWSSNGSDLTSVARYAQGPCLGKMPGTCTFDTRASFNGIESVTAYGKGYNWNSDGTAWSNNGFDLTTITRYK